MGAKDSEIFLQFLIESITLSVFGAAVGLGLGIVLVKAISGFFPGGMAVSTFGILISTGFAVGVGLFAGLNPSISAARLQPVEALRA